MRSSKSRSRNNKNRNNRPTGGNIINRVFDSSGPDGKVRGTPQQIIEKYNQLHRDALLNGDRVDAENFAQHAEHYTRMLAEAQREVDAKREELEEENRRRQAERDRERNDRLRQQEEQANGGNAGGDGAGRGSEQGPRHGGNRGPDLRDADPVIDGGESDSGLVETPEARFDSAPEQANAPQAQAEKPAAAAKKPRAPRARKPRAPKPDAADGSDSTPEAAE